MFLFCLSRANFIVLLTVNNLTAVASMFKNIPTCRLSHSKDPEAAWRPSYLCEISFRQDAGLGHSQLAGAAKYRINTAKPLFLFTLCANRRCPEPVPHDLLETLFDFDATSKIRVSDNPETCLCFCLVAWLVNARDDRPSFPRHPCAIQCVCCCRSCR
jgi:hypothetical protein